MIKASNLFTIPEVIDDSIEGRFVDGEMMIDVASTIFHAAVIAIIVNPKNQ